MAAEGGTSGKNSSTDQRQIQATSQSGSVFTGDGPVNTGTSITTGGGAVNITDQGAVAAAFQFGDNIAKTLTKATTDSAAANAAAVKFNTDFLGGATNALLAQTGAGQSNSTNKLLLIGVAVAVVAYFIFRR